MTHPMNVDGMLQRGFRLCLSETTPCARFGHWFGSSAAAAAHTLGPRSLQSALYPRQNLLPPLSDNLDSPRSFSGTEPRIWDRVFDALCNTCPISACKNFPCPLPPWGNDMWWSVWCTA